MGQAAYYYIKEAALRTILHTNGVVTPKAQSEFINGVTRATNCSTTDFYVVDLLTPTINNSENLTSSQKVSINNGIMGSQQTSC